MNHKCLMNHSGATLHKAEMGKDYHVYNLKNERRHEHQTGGWKDDVCFFFSDREQRETSCSSRERFIMLAVLLYGLGSPLLALAIGLLLFWGFVDLLDFCNLARFWVGLTQHSVFIIFWFILE